MPMWLLQAYEEAIPQLQAQEAITAANIAAIGSGSMKKKDRDRTLKRWKRAANKGVGVARKPGLKAVAQKFGFAVINEEKPDE